MKKRQTVRKAVAKEMSPVEIHKNLQRIGKLIKTKRQARTTLESFSYEISISRSSMGRYESGSDMYLSTFLKLLYGLDTLPEDFFKDLPK